MIKNLELWEKVAATDPKYTKLVEYGKRKYTTINAQFQIRNATEQFGTYGKGFGIESTTYEHLPLQDRVLLICHAIFFYKIGDDKYSFPISSSILLLDRDKYDKYNVDDEAYKKIETDITTKALSKLGFNADVFLGQYDDNRYVNSMKEKFAESKPEAKIAEIKPEDESKIIRGSWQDEINKCKTETELMYLYNSNKTTVDIDTKIKAMFTKRKIEINIKK